MTTLINNIDTSNQHTSEPNRVLFLVFSPSFKFQRFNVHFANVISISWVPRLESRLEHPLWSRRKTVRGKERANEGSSSERKSSLLPRAFGLTTRSRLQRRQHIFQIKQLKAFWLFFNIATSKLKALLRLRPLSWSIFLGYTSHPSRFSANMQNLCKFSLSDVFVSYYLLTKLSQKLSVQYLATV